MTKDQPAKPDPEAPYRAFLKLVNSGPSDSEVAAALRASGQTVREAPQGFFDAAREREEHYGEDD